MASWNFWTIHNIQITASSQKRTIHIPKITASSHKRTIHNIQITASSNLNPQPSSLAFPSVIL